MAREPREPSPEPPQLRGGTAGGSGPHARSCGAAGIWPSSGLAWAAPGLSRPRGAASPRISANTPAPRIFINFISLISSIFSFSSWLPFCKRPVPPGDHLPLWQACVCVRPRSACCPLSGAPLSLTPVFCLGAGVTTWMDSGLPRGHTASYATCWPRLPRALVQPSLAPSPAGPAWPHSASLQSLQPPALLPRPPFI